jgi:very-short-patch-repair endonuclease
MRRQSSKVRLARVADRQWGRVTWAQIRTLGIDPKAVTDWLRQGYLHRRLPGVYAVGHACGSIEADLAAALLYAGPGAMLSHATAAWWWGLMDDRPPTIHVSTPRQCLCQPGITVHTRRKHRRVWHRGLPTTSIPQILLEVAATNPLRVLRRALAKADYAGILQPKAVAAHLGGGRPGSAALRVALAEHLPGLARTKSQLETLFLELCESARLPMPEINVRVAGWEVDALFREACVAVELDGHRNHRSPAQVKRDRRKELALRSAGFMPLRYSDEQLTDGRNDVLADLQRVL